MKINNVELYIGSFVVVLLIGIGIYRYHDQGYNKEVPILEEEQSIFAHNVALLIDHIETRGYLISLGEAYRTPEQAAWYSKAGIGIKNSLHCRRLAIDLNIFDVYGNKLMTNKDYKFAGDYWESLDTNNRWGGNFIHEGGHINDPDHFEMKPIK